MAARPEARPGVLADHKRVGKKFVPPFLADLGPFNEIRWANDLVPELAWIALLCTTHGLKTGTDLARRMALASVGARRAKDKAWFAVTSTYTVLDSAEQQAVLAALEHDRVVQPIREALSPLLVLYPECPLRFLVGDDFQAPNDSLETFTKVLASLFDKSETPATFAQATAVYIAFVSDMLKVFKGLALAKFPAIEHFPSTEESQRVASSVRSTMLLLYEHFKVDQSSAWISYFWRRGLELDGCKFDTGELR